MQILRVPSKIEAFQLPTGVGSDASVVIPTVKGIWMFKYGKHACYFMNFRALNGLCVSISHRDIIGPGLNRLKKASLVQDSASSVLRCLSRKYHCGFNSLEQIMLMTVPHAVTSIGEGRFIVNLWSYFGYLVVDCRAKTVTYHVMDETPDDHVLGSQQWFDPKTEDLYGMSYSLQDSFRRLSDPRRPVGFRIFKHKLGSDGTETIWSGELADFMHDIAINETRQYCVVCELGMYLDACGDLLPSKVLILDLKNKREWTLDRFIVAAHAQFDPQEPDVVYISNHNFQFEHSSFLQLLKTATYSVRFRGPAAVFKYRLTDHGPREIGVFTRPDFFRLTNMHVFDHRGQKKLAATGFPDSIFFFDADSRRFLGKTRVKDPCSWRQAYSKKPAVIGTFAPSPNGEKLFVQTGRSFQVVDVETGKPDYIRDFFFNHTCSNHMLAASDTAW